MITSNALVKNSYNSYSFGSVIYSLLLVSDLVQRLKTFVSPPSDNTSCATVLCQLLQSLQKISSEAEARSRQLVPLFFKFLGYDSDVYERWSCY